MTKICWKCKGEIPDVCKQCQWCGALFESEWSSRPPAYIARQEIQWDPDNPKLLSVIDEDNEKRRKRQAEIQATVDKVGGSPHKAEKWTDRHRDATIVGAVACLVAIFVLSFSRLI